MDDIFLHDQKGDAADCRYSVQTEEGGVLFLFNECGITAREIFETFKAGRGRAAGQGWQDISTAPQDGTRILAWCARDNLGQPRIATTWWRRAEDNRGYIGWGEFNATRWPATHWMPLPAPPAIIADQHGGEK